MNTKVKIVDDNLAGGIFRFLAFCGDLAIAYTLHFYLQSFAIYKNSIYTVTAFFQKLPMYKLVNHLFWDSVIAIILVYSLYILIRFYSVIIFGVSFSQWILGIRGGKGFIWNRIGGIFRTIVEAILTPFIIFDLPCLWGTPTLKEIMSGTKLCLREGIYSYVVLPIFIPVTIGLAFLAPLFFNLTLIDGLKIDHIETKLHTLPKNADFKSFKHYSSELFKFDAFSSLKDEHFVLIPNFEIVSEGGKKRIYPNLLIYDRTNKTFGILKVSKKISMLKLISEGRKGNPLFSFKYPALAKALKKSDDYYKTKVYDERYAKNTLFSLRLKHELSMLVKDSLRLNMANIYKHAFNNGPFINGYVKIKNRILRIIPEGKAPRIVFQKLGNYEFINLKQNFEFYDEFRKNNYETLIPIGTNNASVLEFNYSDNEASPESWKNFKEYFWASIVWFFDYENIFEFPRNLGELTPLHILDYFALRDLEVEKRKIFETYIIDYYYDLAKKILERKENDLRKLLIVILGRYENVITLRNLKNANYYSDELQRKLNSIKLSLKIKNLESFK